jgi:hypothetical protein
MKAQERCISKIRPSSEAARASRKLRDGGKLGYLEEDAAIGVVVIRSSWHDIRKFLPLFEKSP